MTATEPLPVPAARHRARTRPARNTRHRPVDNLAPIPAHAATAAGTPRADFSRVATRSSGTTLPKSYYPAVDGMRAVAIISVLVFHTGVYANGLFGVDLFFVLSGFLITLTLMREYHRTGAIKLGTFYVRRIKRLLPMLVLVLGLTLWAVTAFGDTATRERFSKQAIASLVYVTNWEQIAAGQNYWDGFGHINPLGHMWSLAITEQFYLAWPVLLVIVLMIGRRTGVRGAHAVSRARPYLVLAVALVGYVVACLQPLMRFDGSNSDRMYLGTDTHVMGLLAGAAAAAANYLWLRHRADRGTQPIRGRARSVTFSIAVTVTSSVLGTTIVVLAINASDYSQPWLYSWGFAAVAGIGALFIVTLTSPSNVITKLFAVKPLVEIGKVSYTMFLIHMPLFWLITAITPESTPIDVLIVGVPFALLGAGALHHLFAEPVRLGLWKVRGSVSFMTWMAATAAAIIVLPGLVMTAPAGTGAVRVLTLGDSLANDFASSLASNAGDTYSVVDGGLPGCGIAGSTQQRTAVGITQDAAQGCNPWAARWTQLIEKADADVILVNIAWDAVQQNMDGSWTDLTDPAFAEQYRASLEQMSKTLSQSDAQVVITNSRLYNAVVTPEQATTFNTILSQFLAQHPEYQLFDLHNAVCTTDACPVETSEGEPMYLDDRVHFSEAGKKELALSLAEALKEATG